MILYCLSPSTYIRTAFLYVYFNYGVIFSLQMDDSKVIATGEMDSNKLTTVGTNSPKITEKVMNSVTDAEQILLTAVDDEAAMESEEINNNSSSLPLSQDLLTQEPVTMTTNATHPSPGTDTQASVMSSGNDTSKASSTTTTPVVNSGVSSNSTEDGQLQSTNTAHLSATTTTNTTTATVPTSVQTGTTNIGTDDTYKAASAAKEIIQLASSSSEIRDVTGATASSSPVMNSTSAGNSSSVGAVAAAAYNLPNTVKLESSMLGKGKMTSQDFDVPLQKPAIPIIGAAGYNANKVAAEMAKIDSFLASLAKVGASTNPVPSMNFSKPKKQTAAASKHTPVGSALGNIALSYGYSEEESSSSSSDESEGDQQATVKLTNPTAADAVIAMDTQEVEKSMKKVTVSSDSSSSSSEDELG